MKRIMDSLEELMILVKAQNKALLVELFDKIRVEHGYDIIVKDYDLLVNKYEQIMTDSISQYEVSCDSYCVLLDKADPDCRVSILKNYELILAYKVSLAKGIRIL